MRRVRRTQSLQPAEHDLPAVQCLDAVHHAVDLESPVAHTRTAELLDLHGERRGSRVTAGNGDKLANDVQGDLAAVKVARPADDFAKYDPGETWCVALLVEAHDVPRGPPARHQLGVETENA